MNQAGELLLGFIGVAPLYNCSLLSTLKKAFRFEKLNITILVT